MDEHSLKMSTVKRVLLNHTGGEGQITLVSLLRFMQECAWYHAETLGFGIDSLAEKGLIWVLREQSVLVTRFPQMGERLVIETWPSKAERILCHRDFLVHDEQGNEIARATTVWFGLDLASRRPRKADFFFRPGWENFPASVFDTPLPELPTQDMDTEAEERSVRFSDLDALGHMNNLRYIEWIMDSCCGQEETRTPKMFQIRYARELMLDDKVRIVTSEITQGVVAARISKEGGYDACLARIAYFE